MDEIRQIADLTPEPERSEGIEFYFDTDVDQEHPLFIRNVHITPGGRHGRELYGPEVIFDVFDRHGRELDEKDFTQEQLEEIDEHLIELETPPYY